MMQTEDHKPVSVWQTGQLGKLGKYYQRTDEILGPDTVLSELF